MATVIEEIPDPWRPYKDGRLWRLTHAEMHALPSWTPHTDSLTGCITGLRRIIWSVVDGYAVRFTDTPAEIELLARHGDIPAMQGVKLWEDLMAAAGPLRPTP